MTFLLAPLTGVALLLTYGASAVEEGNSTSGATDAATPISTDAANASDPRAMVPVLKGVFIASTLLLSMIINRLVVKHPFLNEPKYKLHISTANAFSAGIFIVLSVAHLLPESVDVLAHQYEDKTHAVYRPPYIVCVAGYFFMIMLQRGLFAFDENMLIEAAVEESAPSLTGSPSVASPGESSEEDREEAGSRARRSASGTNQTEMLGNTPYGRTEEVVTSTAMVEVQAESPTEPQGDGGITESTTDSGASSSAALTHRREQAQRARNHRGKPTKEHLPLFVLLTVFVIHSFTEGMVLGLQKEKNGVILVFLAIFLHQWAEDVTFALRTGKGGALSHKWRLILTSVEALSCPLGQAVGWGLETVLSEVVVAYITTFSAGTFLMIATTEVVPEALVSGKRNVPQFIAMVLGGGLLYGVMALLEIYVAPSE